MLIGIVVQRFTSRESSKMEPPVLVHEANRLPVPEILQVRVTQNVMIEGLLAIMFDLYSFSFRISLSPS